MKFESVFSSSMTNTTSLSLDHCSLVWCDLAIRYSAAPILAKRIKQDSIKVEFRVARQQVLGVPQPAAVLAGTPLGIAVLALVVRFVSTLWVAALVSMVYGLIVVIPEALLLRVWRWARDSIAG